MGYMIEVLLSHVHSLEGTEEGMSEGLSRGLRGWGL